MAQAYKLEDPGEGITEAEVVEVHVSEGDKVKDGDVLVSVETDKAVNDIPAPFDGTIEKVKVHEGDSIEVGQVLVEYDDGGGSGERKQAAKEESIDREEKPSTTESEGRETVKARESGERTAGERREPSAESTGQDEGRDRPAHIRGESDDHNPGGPVPAAPATRRLARELDVDLKEVSPSGPEGRVTEDDVRAFAESGDESRETTARRAPEKAAALPDFSQWGHIEREPLRSVRRATAKQMDRAWQRIPHVMHQSVADVTELERFRRRYKDEVADKGGKLTLTVLVMKAAVAALKQFPRFNASLDWDNEEIILKHHYHLGLAVATDRGLLVPVIRDVDRKDITELAVETVNIAERARQGELRREEMRGGTFSLTNPGPLGGTSVTPIINYPEAAILGMCATRLEPVAIGDIDDFSIAAQLRLPLCLVYDHRLNDGADAARFLQTVIDILEDPETFLLSV